MGQVLKRMYEAEERKEKNVLMKKTMPDLGALPPELALLVLSHLNATDLCLAGCVWQNLADDEVLWHG